MSMRLLIGSNGAKAMCLAATSAAMLCQASRDLQRLDASESADSAQRYLEKHCHPRCDSYENPLTGYEACTFDVANMKPLYTTSQSPGFLEKDAANDEFYLQTAIKDVCDLQANDGTKIWPAFLRGLVFGGESIGQNFKPWAHKDCELIDVSKWWNDQVILAAKEQERKRIISRKKEELSKKLKLPQPVLTLGQVELKFMKAQHLLNSALCNYRVEIEKKAAEKEAAEKKADAIRKLVKEENQYNYDEVANECFRELRQRGNFTIESMYMDKKSGFTEKRKSRSLVKQYLRYWTNTKNGCQFIDWYTEKYGSVQVDWEMAKSEGKEAMQKTARFEVMQTIITKLHKRAEDRFGCSSLRL